MNVKLAIYIVNFVLVFLTVSGLDLEKKYKVDNPLKTNIIYFLVAISIVYLATNCMFDIITLIGG